jgi:hypothetical protein
MKIKKAEGALRKKKKIIVENLNRKYSKARAQSSQVVTVNQTLKSNTNKSPCLDKPSPPPTLSNEERETKQGHEDVKEKNGTESRRRRTLMVTRTRRINTIN